MGPVLRIKKKQDRGEGGEEKEKKVEKDKGKGRAPPPPRGPTMFWLPHICTHSGQAPRNNCPLPQPPGLTSHRWLRTAVLVEASQVLHAASALSLDGRLPCAWPPRTTLPLLTGLPLRGHGRPSLPALPPRAQPGPLLRTPGPAHPDDPLSSWQGHPTADLRSAPWDV